MAYVILKTNERRRRPVMQRLFMGLLVTLGVFFGYEYVFDQTPDVMFEPTNITEQTIAYSITISNIQEEDMIFLLVVKGDDTEYRIESTDTVFSGNVRNLTANTTYSFTIYTLSETTQTKIFETEVSTKEMVNDE